MQIVPLLQITSRVYIIYWMKPLNGAREKNRFSSCFSPRYYYYLARNSSNIFELCMEELVCAACSVRDCQTLCFVELSGTSLRIGQRMQREREPLSRSVWKDHQLCLSDRFRLNSVCEFNLETQKEKIA